MRTTEQIYKRYKQFATGVTKDEFITAVKNIQNEAFNHALETAAKYSTTCANDECTSIIVDKDSILKLKLDYSAEEHDEDIRYTEEEVRELFIARSKEFSTKYEPFNKLLLKQDMDWFEENKKK